MAVAYAELEARYNKAKYKFIDQDKLWEVRDYVADWDNPFTESLLSCPIIKLHETMNYNIMNKSKGDAQ